MKAYGVKRSDACQFGCEDCGCVDLKYRLMRGHSHKTRKNAFKQAKSAERFRSRQLLRREEYDAYYPYWLHPNNYYYSRRV
jgi:hypothetical protein